MKRIVALCTCLVLVALYFTGCRDMLFNTAEYRSYQSFADNHKAGTEKQKILDKLGYPDGYVDAQGSYQTITHADQESFKENLSTDTSTT